MEFYVPSGLYPCPFCGSDKVGLICELQFGYEFHGVQCEQCFASIKNMAHPEDALKAWNRRER